MHQGAFRPGAGLLLQHLVLQPAAEHVRQQQQHATAASSGGRTAGAGWYAAGTSAAELVGHVQLCLISHADAS